MSSILFVFEGKKTEMLVMQSFESFFLREKMIIKCAYGAEIYQLYVSISKDRDLDTFSLLKENELIKDLLKGYKRDDFSEIYLFFDYDGHSSLANDDILEEMLDLFNEETEEGKLLISYPMIESIKHISNTMNFQFLKVDAKKNIGYKQIVENDCRENFKHFNRYSQETWNEIIEYHLKKMNYVVKKEFSIPSYQSSQKVIFSKQRENYINIDSTIAVLNAFPIFVFDYYGSNYRNLFLEQTSNRIYSNNPAFLFGIIQKILNFIKRIRKKLK
jgi:hypothetical protein